jgi:D-alanyl-D-alanine carboxypeptidase (penicillin-binding protein 5/6)
MNNNKNIPPSNRRNTVRKVVYTAGPNGNNNKNKPRKRKPDSSRLVLSFLLFSVMLIVIIFALYKCAANNADKKADDITTQPESVILATVPPIVDDTNKSPDVKPVILGSEVYSDNVIMVNLNTDQVICEKGQNETAYPASLTKIMTVITAIEKISSAEYDTAVTLEADIFDYLYAQNAALAGFEPGENVTVMDLFYGTMLPSGAEAAIGLARYSAGSEANFTELMNAKAGEIGCINTRFINVTGLHDLNHYTTASDIELILQYALKNELFRKIFTTEWYTTQATNVHANGVTFHNTTFANFTANNYDTGSIIGGKTGYTEAAGLCLATLAAYEGSEYILITLGAGDGGNDVPYQVMDAVYLYGEYVTKTPVFSEKDEASADTTLSRIPRQAPSL